MIPTLAITMQIKILCSDQNR